MENNSLEVDIGGSQKEKMMISRIKQFFLLDTTSESGTFLVKQKRQLMKHLQEMKKQEQQINMKKDFTIAGITNHCFYISSLPVDDKEQLFQIYSSSLLAQQTYANGKKCAVPKVRFLSQVEEADGTPRCCAFDDQVTLQIQIQYGARLVLTTDGKFPEESHPGAEIILEANYQRRFTTRCILRIKAQKEGLLDSNCISFQLVPKVKPGQERKREFNLVKKSDARFELSNSMEQSDIQFPS